VTAVLEKVIRHFLQTTETNWKPKIAHLQFRQIEQVSTFSEKPFPEFLLKSPQLLQTLWVNIWMCERGVTNTEGNHFVRSFCEFLVAIPWPYVMMRSCNSKISERFRMSTQSNERSTSTILLVPEEEITCTTNSKVNWVVRFTTSQENNACCSVSGCHIQGQMEALENWAPSQVSRK
jgi:hypothetical protein